MHTRRLAAIMFTDIAGYTALMQSDEAKALQIRNRHREVFEELHKKHNGTILQYYGDGTLSIFDSAIEAANCAVAMQLAFQEEPKVPLRIGIHTGDILYSAEEAVGDGVNVASRIESMAVPGSVMISDTVHEYLKNQPNIPLKSMGSFQFKNVERKMEVFAVEKEGLAVPFPGELSGKFAEEPIKKTFLDKIPAWGKYIGGLALFLILAPFIYFPIINSLTGNAQDTVNVMDEDGKAMSQKVVQFDDKKKFLVAPFNNLDENEETDWLKTGFPYALEMDWDQDPYIFNVFHERSRSTNLNAKIEQAKKVGCDFVLLGDYKVDTAYHLTLKVFEVASGQERFQVSHRGKELFSFMDEVSLRVKEEFGVPESHLKNTIDLPISQFLTNSEEAYEDFINGIIESTRTGSQALEQLTVAADKDPTFAWANYMVSMFHHRYQRSEAKAKKYAATAMKHRSRLPDIFEIDVRILNYKVNGDEEKVLKLTEMLVELNPGNDSYFNNLITEYFAQNKYEKLIDAVEKQRKVTGKKNANWLREIIAYLRLGEFNKAEKLAKKMVEKEPDNAQALSILGNIYLSDHEWEEARSTYEKFSLLIPDYPYIDSIWNHIDFMENGGEDLDFEELYQEFVGQYWIENFANFEIDIIAEEGLLYIYPPSQSKMQLFASSEFNYSTFQGFGTYFKRDSSGKISYMMMKESGEAPYPAVKISTEVNEAVQLFKQGKLEAAAPKIEALIPKNSRLSFLANLKKHIDYFQTVDPEEKKASYEELLGKYEGGGLTCELIFQDDQLAMDITGITVYQEPIPAYEIEKDLFINLMALNGMGKIIRKNGKVTAFELIMSGKQGESLLMQRVR